MSAPVLPVWSVPALRAVVDAADRPCTVSPAMVALFEAVTEDEGQGADVVEARGVCGACPVRVACLALAMAPVTEVVDGVPETVPYAPVGVWGGLTGPERAELAGYLVADPNTVPVVPVGAVGPFVGPDWCAVCGLRLSSRHPGHRYCSVQCRADGAGGGAPCRSAGGGVMTTFVVLMVVVLAVVMAEVRRRVRVSSWDGADLSDWHPRHRVPAGDVWAVTPPCGYGHWTLFAPGSRSGPWPYEGITPAAVHPVDGFGGDSDRLRLADVEAWMRPWIERVAGGAVVEMVEGWSEPYGPSGRLQEYVIYARVVIS